MMFMVDLLSSILLLSSQSLILFGTPSHLQWYSGGSQTSLPTLLNLTFKVTSRKVPHQVILVWSWIRLGILTSHITKEEIWNLSHICLWTWLETFFSKDLPSILMELQRVVDGRNSIVSKNGMETSV